MSRLFTNSGCNGLTKAESPIEINQRMNTDLFPSKLDPGLRRRLQNELSTMLSGVTEEEGKAVDEGMLIHALESAEISCKAGAQRQRQQVLPLAELALRAYAPGDLQCRDNTPLDLLRFRRKTETSKTSTETGELRGL